MINVSGINIGNDLPVFLISGPCMMESREQSLKIAAELSKITQDIGIPFIFKASFDKANRSSSNSMRGVGLDKSLEIFKEIKETFGCPVVTDVHESYQCELVAGAVDVLQIPAMLCRQTDLIKSAVSTGRTINIKKGQFMSPQEMENVANKAEGSPVMLCERGASFGYNNLVSDMRSLQVMKGFGHPVIFDATHSVQRPGALGTMSGGERCFIETLSRAAISVGVAGIFIETHYDPASALSDSSIMVPLHLLRGLLENLKRIDELVKSMEYTVIKN